MPLATSSAVTILPDPISTNEAKQFLVPVDRLLDYNGLDKVFLNLKTIFVTVPKTVWKGLKGNDPDFGFSDALLLAKIPYYLGGPVLALSFAAGRDFVGASKIGVAAGLYYLGMGVANKLINGLVRLKTGVDLSLKYQRVNGQVENVFGSIDFPRVDLLDHAYFKRVAPKMGIPGTVLDVDSAVKEQLRRIISTARTMKLILGAALAAVGAGFVARSEHWAKLLDIPATLGRIWSPSANYGGFLGSPLRRLADSLQAPWAVAKLALSERFVQAAPHLRWPRVFSVVGILSALALSVAGIFRSVRTKDYQAFTPERPVFGDLPTEAAGMFRGFEQSAAVTSPEIGGFAQ